MHGVGAGHAKLGFSLSVAAFPVTVPGMGIRRMLALPGVPAVPAAGRNSWGLKAL